MHNICPSSRVILHFVRPGGSLLASKGVEDGVECFCHKKNKKYKRFGRLDDSECDTPCEGDLGNTCGGSFALEVFKIMAVDASHQVTRVGQVLLYMMRSLRSSRVVLVGCTAGNCVIYLHRNRWRGSDDSDGCRRSDNDDK